MTHRSAALILVLIALALTFFRGFAEEVESGRQLSMVERGMLAEVNDLLVGNDYEKADERLRAIIIQYPDLLPAKQMHAAVMISRQRYGEAIELLESINREHPGNAHILNNLSWLLSTATDPAFRNPARALQLAQDAVFIASEDYHVWNTLAEAHFRNANFDQAVKAMQHALDLAVRSGASESEMQLYQSQMAAMREAVAVMSLME